jgi:hypothetical protein
MGNTQEVDSVEASEAIELSCRATDVFKVRLRRRLGLPEATNFLTVADASSGYDKTSNYLIPAVPNSIITLI